MISTTYRETAVEVSHRRWPNVRYLLRSGNLLAGAWTLAAVFGLAVFGPWLIRVVYTAEFLPSYPVMLVLLIGAAAVNIFYWNRSLLLRLGKPAYPNGVHAIAGSLKIVGSILWVPFGGAMTMAGLLSGYFVVTTGVLVRKSMQVLGRGGGAPGGGAPPPTRPPDDPRDARPPSRSGRPGAVSSVPGRTRSAAAAGHHRRLAELAGS